MVFTIITADHGKSEVHAQGIRASAKAAARSAAKKQEPKAKPRPMAPSPRRRTSKPTEVEVQRAKLAEELASALRAHQRGEIEYPNAHLYGRSGLRTPPQFWSHPEGKMQAWLRVNEFVNHNLHNPQRRLPTPSEIGYKLGLNGYVTAYRSEHMGFSDILIELGFRNPGSKS